MSDEIVSGASNLFGTFTSASIAAVDPAMATTAGMAGALAEETARAILTRVLGFRDQRRVRTVVSHAQQHIQLFQANGVTIRQDDFWQARGNIPPVGQEVFEAVLVAAQKEPQEHKIPYIGNLFAYKACRPEISDVSAHWLVKTAESLSWTQFELLALINRVDEVNAEGISIGEGALTWDSLALHRELGDLGDGEKTLIMGQRTDLENMGLELPSTKLVDWRIALFGTGGPRSWYCCSADLGTGRHAVSPLLWWVLFPAAVDGFGFLVAQPYHVHLDYRTRRG